MEGEREMAWPYHSPILAAGSLQTCVNNLKEQEAPLAAGICGQRLVQGDACAQPGWWLRGSAMGASLLSKKGFHGELLTAEGYSQRWITR